MAVAPRLPSRFSSALTFLPARTCSLQSPPSRSRISALAQNKPSSISISLYRSSCYYQLQSRGQCWQILSTDSLICHLLGCRLSSPPPSRPPTPALFCFLIFACHFFPLPPSIDPLCAKRERGWKSEINTWTGEPAGISIEMEVWSHSPGFDEPLSSLRHRTVNITECLDME